MLLLWVWYHSKLYLCYSNFILSYFFYIVYSNRVSFTDYDPLLSMSTVLRSFWFQVGLGERSWSSLFSAPVNFCIGWISRSSSEQSQFAWILPEKISQVHVARGNKRRFPQNKHLRLTVQNLWPTICNKNQYWPDDPISWKLSRTTHILLTYILYGKVGQVVLCSHFYFTDSLIFKQNKKNYHSS